MTRVNFDLNEMTMCRLKKLKKQTDASGYAEVLRNALRAYEAQLFREEQQRKGKGV